MGIKHRKKVDDRYKRQQKRQIIPSIEGNKIPDSSVIFNLFTGGVEHVHGSIFRGLFSRI